MNEATAANAAGDATRPPSSAGRAQWVVIFLWMVVVASGANALLAMGAASSGTPLGMEVFKDAAEGDYDFDPVAAVHLLLILLTVLTFFASMVTYFLWVYRARVRQRWFSRQLGFSDERSGISPTYSILVWFIPVANFVLPYNDVHDLVTTEPTDPGDRRLLLPLWWGSFIVAYLLTTIGNRLAQNDLDMPLWFDATTHSSLALAALLAARWIGEFERRTARRTVPQTTTAAAASIA